MAEYAYRPCLHCGKPVRCDPDYPSDARIVHPACAFDATVAEYEQREIPLPDWMDAIKVLRDAQAGDA